uniref:Family with sequence similarity 117 member A n=1 Tax=Oncorhynchus kisutch TaxID=8019 RepID=A0A8C7IWA0_ONCKI
MTYKELKCDVFWLFPSGDRSKSRPPKPTIRRTLSLDTIVGPYLQGRWPKEAESQGVTCVNDKATQKNSTAFLRSWCHQAAWLHHRHAMTGMHIDRNTLVLICVATWPLVHTLTLKPLCVEQIKSDHTHSCAPFSCVLGDPPPPPPPQTVPLSRLAPRLRRSVEGLNLELEGVFVSETPEDQHKPLDPSSDSQLALISLQWPVSHSLTVPSPCSPVRSWMSQMATEPQFLPRGAAVVPRVNPPLPLVLDPSLLQPSSSSPRPNKTYSFQREPPEGCERVRVVCEEAMSPRQREPLLQVSCPDPNKVNFTPHGGSAFCPVSLLKPLLPSMDLLFRGLSVSPVTGCSGQGSAPYQTVGHSVGGYMSGPLQDATTM